MDTKTATGTRPAQTRAQNAPPQVVPKAQVASTRPKMFGVFRFKGGAVANDPFYWHNNKLVVQNSNSNPKLGILRIELSAASQNAAEKAGIIAKANVTFGTPAGIMVTKEMKDVDGVPTAVYTEVEVDENVFDIVQDFSITQNLDGKLSVDDPSRPWNPKNPDGSVDKTKQNRAYMVNWSSKERQEAVHQQILAAMEATGALEFDREAEFLNRAERARLRNESVGGSAETQVSGDTTV